MRPASGNIMSEDNSSLRDIMKVDRAPATEFEYGEDQTMLACVSVQKGIAMSLQWVLGSSKF